MIMFLRITDFDSATLLFDKTKVINCSTTCRSLTLSVLPRLNAVMQAGQPSGGGLLPMVMA
ncbi:hypothetical protein Ancab_004841 [Ancistrocladus abbreviatus]